MKNYMVLYDVKTGHLNIEHHIVVSSEREALKRFKLEIDSGRYQYYGLIPVPIETQINAMEKASGKRI